MDMTPGQAVRTTTVREVVGQPTAVGGSSRTRRREKPQSCTFNNVVSKLWTTSTLVGTPLASPDGRHLAFTVSAYNSNTWIIENS